jgi:agmatinase
MTSEEFFASPRNFAGLLSPFSDIDYAKTLILPVPYDGTSEWHTGSRNGPQAIIDASEYLEFYDLDLDKEIQNGGIHTLPFIQPDFSSPEKTVDRVYQVCRQFVAKSKFILSLGGEHTISLGPVKAYLEKYPDLSVMQLDAHADLRDEYNGAKVCQATVIKRIRELCPTVQAGIRSLSLEEKLFIDSEKIPITYGSNFMRNTGELSSIVGSLSDNVYLTLDMDILDPSIMSAVGTPEPGGLLWEDLLATLEFIASKKNIVGADLVELCPQEGPASCTFLTAKLAYKIIGYFVK